VDHWHHARYLRWEGDGVSSVPGERSVVSKRVANLRTNSFAAVVMLLIQYGLGIWVNLYAKLPQADQGATVITGVVRAITNGPVGLTLHAILGLILIATATTAIIRTTRIGRELLLVIAVVGLVSILLAGITGARFVGTGDNGASLIMALATAVAILCYALILFVTGPLPGSRVSESRASNQQQKVV
jgi:hypothetical protein